MIRTASRRGITLILILSTLCVAGPALAAPPLPPIEGQEDRELEYDWVQMKSGEWLKGEFTMLEDDTLYFDSDEFDEQSLDWADVETLISSGPHIFRLDGEKPVIKGTFEMKDGVVRIDTGDSAREVPSARLLAILPGEGRELDYWHAKASVGFSVRSGNTNQSDLTTRIEVRRQTANTRFRTKYLGNISELEGDATANSHSVPSSFDYFLTQRLFLNLASLNYHQDEFQNLDSRLTAGMGIGYEFYKNSWVSWEVVGGAAYQSTKFIEVASGSLQASDVAATISTEIEFDLPRGLEWDNLYSAQVVVTDIDKTSHHAESVVAFDIWGPLELDLSFIFDRIESPAPTATDVPASNDYRMTVGLALDL